MARPTDSRLLQDWGRPAPPALAAWAEGGVLPPSPDLPLPPLQAGPPTPTSAPEDWAAPGALARWERLMAQARRTFALDLSGLTVYTEAASGYFALTPVMAALAGAARVFALGRDSVHGSLAWVTANLRQLADRLGCGQRITITSQRRAEEVAQADIVTNLGFVRPIDHWLIDRMKPTAAVPLMWEPWELRPQELDLEHCRLRGICVLGTDEGAASLRTMEFVGMLAVKLLLELQVEVLLSRVLVLGGGAFGRAACNHLGACGAQVAWVGPERPAAGAEMGQVPAFGDLGQPGAREFLSAADALLVVEHQMDRMLIGKGAALDFAALARLNPGLRVAHICGSVDAEGLARCGLPFAPARISPFGRMSVTTAHLGPRPLVDLHSAGLRVGEALTRARLAGQDPRQAVATALARTPAKDF